MKAYEIGLLIYCLYVIWTMLGKPPVAATVWYYLDKDWKTAAAYFGALGIAAELAYDAAIRKASLAL